MKLLRYLFVIITIISFLVIVDNVDAREKPLPNTQPKITVDGKKALISWYNTKPGTYTVLKTWEKCTTTRCISYAKVEYKKYLGIGNVRITISKYDKHSNYRVINK